MMGVAPAVCVIAIMCADITGEGRYRQARSAETQGRYTQALEGYAHVAEGAGPLALYAQARAAACLAAEGETDRAIAAYTTLIEQAEDGPWIRMATAELALLFQEHQKASDAAPYFDQILDVPHQPWWYDRYVWRAHENAFDLPGDHNQSAIFFETIVETSIYKAKRVDASRVLADSNADRHRLLGVVGLIRAGAKTEARRRLDAMAKEGAGDSAFAPRVAFLKSLLNVNAATPLPEAGVLEPLDEAPWVRQALAHLVNAYGAQGAFEPAKALCDVLVAVCPDAPEAGEALWRYAQWARKKGHPQKAFDAYMELAVIAPGHRYADDALLHAAELEGDLDGNEKALALLKQLAETYPTRRLAPKAWITVARLHKQGNNDDAMVSALKQAADGPLGQYYVHRAGQRLHEMHLDGPSSTPKVLLAGDETLIRPQPWPARTSGALPEQILNDVRYQRLQFFGENGFEEGEWEALHLLAGDADSLWDGLLHRVLAETGLAHTASQHLAQVQSRPAAEARRAENLRVHYPRVHWASVQRLGKEAGVDPYLILAVGRQESTFRPNLTSHAGARGLMQIMPATAKWMAEVDPDISKEDADRYHDPIASLRLGAFYLRRMLDTWDGNVVYALASYNGGPGNTRKWVKTHGSKSLESFVESIPYSETQDFVKRVLGNYAAYYSLYPAHSASPAMAQSQEKPAPSRQEPTI
jgi:soluble lytic murein transglycosylase-like protein